jgi:transposase-like protein
VSRLDVALDPKAGAGRRVEAISGGGGRRRWSNDEKARAVGASLAPGVVVSEVARARGGRLGVRVNTARTHLQRIFDKTSVHSQAPLVRGASSNSRRLRRKAPVAEPHLDAGPATPHPNIVTTPPSMPQNDPPVAPIGLIALSVAAFAVGTGEFIVAGILPDLSADLGVGITKAGLLVSVYAAAVAMGGPILALATAGFRRKPLILALLAVVCLGQAFCAIAPNYSWLMAGPKSSTSWSSPSETSTRR